MLDTTAGRQARVHYLSGSYRVLSPGDYVLCAVTGARISLGQLRYWSFERQEAYATSQIATERARQGAE
jgi:hypothetical protein